MDDEVFRQITRVREYFADPKNYYQLLRHVTYEAAKYRWFGSKSQSLPSGNSPEDLVQELIKQVLDEDINSHTRSRLPEYVEIGKALRMQLRSKLSALVQSRENRTLRRETDVGGDASEEGIPSSQPPGRDNERRERIASLKTLRSNKSD
ncbi:MAG: hypothetical protein WC661_02145 [Opitutaceae bacterium]|jgi:hypothetical protein